MEVSGFVAKIRINSQVERGSKVSYNFNLLRFYKTQVLVVLARMLITRVISIEKKCNITLENGEDYVFGCKAVGWCHFVRDYRKLKLPNCPTTHEKKSFIVCKEINGYVLEMIAVVQVEQNLPVFTKSWSLQQLEK
ncbi:hypothetical protein Y032_0049g1753 [Ancylostoma ceylanicum]|nr:hypothetical protein Y032_0049g1753 [Ancylostoma ceylanicum]